MNVITQQSMPRSRLVTLRTTGKEKGFTRVKLNSSHIGEAESEAEGFAEQNTEGNTHGRITRFNGSLVSGLLV